MRSGDLTEGETQGELRFRVDISDAKFLFAKDFPVSGSPGRVSTEFVVKMNEHAQIGMPSEAFTEFVQRFDAFLAPNNRPDASSGYDIHFGIRAATALASQLICVPGEREVVRSLDADKYGRYEEKRFTGRDAIRILTQWHLKGERSRIEAVESFVSKVLDVPIGVRTTLDPSIEVNIAGAAWRELDQVGSGLSQLIIIGISTQLVHNPILLLEEPELSLHPRLQRRLLQVLQEFCEQSIITTHSNHIIDSAESEVKLFYVRREEGGKTTVQLIHDQVIGALRDLGVRPGSLAEANAVLWVEGPSDAIYLRHWLLTLDDGLLEGVNFVFAFHAGSLLTHSTEERDSESLSVFCEINPNYFLVLDRDPDGEGDPSHQYTERWLEHLCAWVTSPKEIEGYISDNALRVAIGRISESATASDTNKSLRDRLLALGLPTSWSKRKVELAKSIVELAQRGVEVLHSVHQADLNTNIRRVLDFIRHCQADKVTL